MILTGHMIRHEINDHLHASLVGTFYQLFKLLHTLIDIGSQIGVDVIVISDRIGRAGLTLDDGRMIFRNTIGCIIGLGSMTDDTRVPDMAHAHLPDFLQGAGREVVHLSTTVLGYRTILLTSGIAIAIKTRENLINNDLIRCHEPILLC